MEVTEECEESKSAQNLYTGWGFLPSHYSWEVSVPHCLIMTADQVSVNIYISCFLSTLTWRNNNHPYYITIGSSQAALSGSQCLQELVQDCLSPVFLLLGLVAIPPEPEEILTKLSVSWRSGGSTEPEYCEKWTEHFSWQPLPANLFSSTGTFLLWRLWPARQLSLSWHFQTSGSVT